MPSRKRAKGRERKLKQQAREPLERSVSQPPPSTPNGENTNLPEQNIPRIMEQAKNRIKCLHGGFMPPRGHPIYNFIRALDVGCVLEVHDHEIDMVGVMRNTFEKHEDVWKYSAMRKMAINIMLSIGMSCLIIDKSIVRAERISAVIIVFEKYTSGDTFDSAFSKATEDLTYLLCAEERDLVHFYRKRTPCSCLDELYAKIKKCQVRGSMCNHCNQTVKRIDIKTCSRCKFAQYCSKECQISAWPSHKELCMELANRHERANNDVETVRSNEGI